MAKQVISLLVYQVGQQKLTTPQTFGVATSQIRPVITPLSPTGNQAGNTGANLDPSLRYRAYAAVSLITPSGAGQIDYFTNKSVADIIADINT